MLTKNDHFNLLIIELIEKWDFASGKQCAKRSIYCPKIPNKNSEISSNFNKKKNDKKIIIKEIKIIIIIKKNKKTKK